jgi:DNA polymerase-3 subunit beta
MRATVQKGIILPVLSKIQGITSRKTNLAITTNVLVKAEDKSLTLSATDLETGFVGSYPAEVEEKGTVALSARKFFEIVRDFPTDTIVFNEIENHWIQIGNESVDYHLVGMNPEDFPEIPKIDVAEFFSIDSMSLADNISKSVVIGAAADDRRNHIIGVYAEFIEEDGSRKFRMVSTDGSRLSKADYIFDSTENIAGMPNVLIPKKSLVELGKFLDAEGVVSAGIKDNNFVVKKENETIIIRLLEGEFPKYGDIILKSDGNHVVMDRQLFSMMLKRMSILSSEEYKGVVFNFDENKLTISSANPEIGESKEEMRIEFSGKPINVMFNPRYFLDSLSVIDDEKVVISIVSDEKPCLIEGENDKRYLSVIMPMRI